MTGNSNNHKTKENEKSSSPEDPRTRGNKKREEIEWDKSKGQKPLLQKIQELVETNRRRKKTVENDWEQNQGTKPTFMSIREGSKKRTKPLGNTRAANANGTMVFEIKIHREKE